MANKDGSSSGGSLIGGIIGAVVGWFIPGVGPVRGFMYGSTIGGLLEPPTGPDQFGPRLDSLTLTTSTNIATLPRSYGTVAHKGNIIWAKGDEYIEVATTKKVRTGLFSKTKVTTYAYFFTGAIAFARSEATAFLRVWHAGGRDLVYSATSTDTDTQVASAEFLKYVTFYYGTADQMPDPLISEAEGPESTSAYRGVIYLVYNMYPLENYQNNIGNLDPKVEYTCKAVTRSCLDHLADVAADPADTDQDRFIALHNANFLDADGVHLWRIGKSIYVAPERENPPGLSLSGEIYHYLAQPDGQLLLKQEYNDGQSILAPGETFWDPWTRACKGKSDRNVAVFTRGIVKAGGSGDGGSPAHPSLLVYGPWAVSLVGFGWTPPNAYEEATLYDAMVSVLDNPGGGPGIASTPEYMFEIGTQEEFDDGTSFGVHWHDTGGFMLTRYIIYCADPDIVPPLPITEEMFSPPSSYVYFMRFQVRVIDVENATDTQYLIDVDADTEIPSAQTYYVFFEDTLYFVYTYSTGYRIVKINPDGSKDFTSRAHTTAISIIKIGILNDQLIIVLKNSSVANFDIFNLDLEYVETKDSAFVVAQFGYSNSDLYNNISFEFDTVYYCVDGHMYSKSSLTDDAPVDMCEVPELILGDDAPALFNIFRRGNLVADSTNGGTMPHIGIQFWTYGIVATPDKVPLADIIVAENKLVGIDASEIDVTTIDQLVRGYTVSEIGPVRNVLQQLQAIYPFDVIQHGYKNKYVKRGSGGTFTVSWQELGVGVSLMRDREMETQLPYRLEIAYIDVDLDYQPNVQFAERDPQKSKKIMRMNIPLVMTATEAAQAADILLSIYRIERRTFKFTLPPTYRNVEPSDIGTLVMKDVTYQVRLDNVNYLANGQLECTGKQYIETVYTSTALGATGAIPKPTTIPSISNPILGVLDIPVIRDARDNKPGYTVVITHPSDSWVGGSVYRSRDGVTYEQVQSFSTITIWGTCIDALSAHGSHVIDEGSTLTIRPLKGEPVTVTNTQFLNEQTLIAYGKPGRWELCAARDVVDNMDGTFTLSYWMRGRRGTEQYTGTHQPGDYFAFVNDGASRFIAALETDIDKTLNHKAITTGRSLDSASVVPLAYGGENLTPRSPVQAFGYRDGSDNFYGRFIPRTRLNSGLTMLEQIYSGAPIGEATEAYEIDVLDGAAVVRTLTVTVPEFEYSVADQVIDFGSGQLSIDFKIYQISATVGRGHVGAFTL